MLGTTLVGRYQIISPLGGGGFGETFVACDTQLPGTQKYEEAIAAYSQAIRHKPNHYESLYSRGNALLNLQKYQEAIASYEQAIKSQPNDPAAINARNAAKAQLEANTPKSVVIPTMPKPKFTIPTPEN
jgi:tetratricopeptide (TPR) repeat protein